MKISNKTLTVASTLLLASMWSQTSHSQQESLPFLDENCSGQLESKETQNHCIDMLRASDFDTGYSIQYSPSLVDPIYINGVKYTLDLARDLNVTTVRDILQAPWRHGFWDLDGHCANRHEFWDDDCRLEDLQQQYHLDAVYEASARIPVSGDNGQLLNFDVFGKIDNAVAWFSVRCGSFREIDISDNIIISKTERTTFPCDEIQVYFKPRRPFNYQDPTLRGFLSIIISEDF